MDKVFLTGGNGFVGLNIVSQLVEQGAEVHAYVRHSSDVKYLEDFPIKIFRGNLSDEVALEEAMSGCRYVIHTAGNTSCYQKDLPILTETNVNGTQSVINVALKTGVERMVFTSTTSTIGGRADQSYQATEQTELKGFRSKSPYAITKMQAEKKLIEAQKHGLEVIILNLAEVIGAFDHNLQWGRMVLAVKYNQVPFIPPGGGSFCSAKQAAKAHINALTEGQSGERYIISGANHGYSDFIHSISRKLLTTFTVPQNNYLWLRTCARLHEMFPKLFKQKPIVESYRMRVFAGHYYFDSQKAQQELGYQVSSLDEMLDETISWYEANGFFQ